MKSTYRVSDGTLGPRFFYWIGFLLIAVGVFGVRIVDSLFGLRWIWEGVAVAFAGCLIIVNELLHRRPEKNIHDRRKMPWNLRIGLWLVQLAVFVGIAWVSIIADAHFNTDRYAPGVEPHRLFPVVAVRAQGTGSNPYEYRLMHWRQVAEFRRREPTFSFNLPESSGSFRRSPGPGLDFSFSATASGSERQRVEVLWATGGDRMYRATYLTDGISVWPVSLHQEGLTAALTLGLIAGLVMAWFAGWLLRRRWSDSLDASKLPAD